MQCVALYRSALFQLSQQTVCDVGQLFRAERIEKHHFIHTAHEFGAKIVLGLLQRFLGTAVGFLRRGTKAQGRILPRQASCPQVGGEQNDGVGKIRLAALGIGQTAVLQNLQQDILDVAVSFLDLIKQNHAVRTAADGFGQLAALVMAHISRRRADHPRNGMLFHIFAHIKAEQGFLAAEPALCQRPGKLGLSYACGAQKQHGADGPSRLPQPGTAAPDGRCHRLDRPGLPDDFLGKPVLQLIQPLPLGLPHPFHRHSAGFADHPGNVRGLQLRQGFAAAVRTADPHRGRRLIQQVNGLVGQISPRQIPYTEFHRCVDGLCRNGNAVVAFVARHQSRQNLFRCRRAGFVHNDLAETAIQRRILLDSAAVFLLGGGTDQLDFAPGQHGL